MKAAVLALCLLVTAFGQTTITSANGKTPFLVAGCQNAAQCGPIRRYTSFTVPIAVSSSPGFQPSQAQITLTATSPAPLGPIQFCLGTFSNQLAVDCTACVAPRLVNPIGNTYTLNDINTGADNWNNQADEVSPLPRPICAVIGAVPQWTGLFVEPVYNCLNDLACTQRDLRPLEPQPAVLLADFAGRTRCCLSGLGARLGVCVNPNQQSCCGGAPYLRAEARCCNNVTELTTGAEGLCPCSRARLPTALTSQTTHPECPVDANTCCLATRFPELNAGQTQGTCYNPVLQRCCNNGFIYDPAVQQCCAIGGIQSANQPCPCETNDHCRGAQINPDGSIDGPTTAYCCRQTAPPLLESQFCSPYANFPEGQSALLNPAQQRCSGKCFNPQYQTCCNGAICSTEFEQCCNSTCCNRHVGTCGTGLRPGAIGSRANYLEFEREVIQCTTIEQLEAIKVFRIFVVPAALLLITLLSLGVVLTFASKASPRGFIFLEKAIILAAVICVFLASFVYFSPAWKYGLLVVLVSLVAVLCVASRIEGLSIFAVFAVLLILLYYLDLWHGNNYLNLAYLRQDNGAPDPHSAGLLYTLLKNWDNARDVRDNNFCTWYFNYFAFDPALRDYERVDNSASPSFGYCSRGWTMALLIIEGLLLPALAALFFLVVLGWVLRFRVIPYEPVELELREVGDDVIIG